MNNFLVQKLILTVFMGVISMNDSYGMENPLIENIDDLPNTLPGDQNTNQLPEIEVKSEITIVQEAQNSSQKVLQQETQKVMMNHEHPLLLSATTPLLKTVIEGQKLMIAAIDDFKARTSLRKELLENQMLLISQVQQIYKEMPYNQFYIGIVLDETLNGFYKEKIEGKAFGTSEYPNLPTKHCTEAQARALLFGIVDQQKIT